MAPTQSPDGTSQIDTLRELYPGQNRGGIIIVGFFLVIILMGVACIMFPGLMPEASSKKARIITRQDEATQGLMSRDHEGNESSHHSSDGSSHDADDDMSIDAEDDDDESDDDSD
jgi:hypothetical protein